MKLKLKNLVCAVFKFKPGSTEESYPDFNVNIADSPWVPYIKNKDTGPLYESFHATRKHPDHPDDYWYNVEKFDKLVESIRTRGYVNKLCNNPSFQDEFNGSDWQGGKGTIKVSPYGNVADGHHRCAILYCLYGPEYEITLTSGGEIEDVPPLTAFYIYVRSGLNNRIMPLMSLLRIARKENKQVKCYWGEDAYTDHVIVHETDLFEPIKDVEFISKKKFVESFFNKNSVVYNKMGSDRDRNEIIYKPEINANDKSSVFYKIVHCISYPSDNVIGNYVPYPKTPILNSPFIDEMRKVMCELTPIAPILQKIEEITNLFTGIDVIGLHLRTTDGGFTDIPKHEAIPFIQKQLEQSPGSKVYVSCDHLELESQIVSAFPGKIIKLDSPFGNSYDDKFDRFTYGTINAVCEMFVLSKCSSFFGTPGSSFSFTTWLLRNETELKFWCDNPW